MTTPMKFRKRPITVEAIQWDGTVEGAEMICQWANAGAPENEEHLRYFIREGCAPDLFCYTLEGPLNASPGDWIIHGFVGEFYACKPDVFAATYDPV